MGWRNRRNKKRRREVGRRGKRRRIGVAVQTDAGLWNRLKRLFISGCFLETPQLSAVWARTIKQWNTEYTVRALDEKQLKWEEEGRKEEGVTIELKPIKKKQCVWEPKHMLQHYSLLFCKMCRWIQNLNEHKDHCVLAIISCNEIMRLASQEICSLSNIWNYPLKFNLWTSS